MNIIDNNIVVQTVNSKKLWEFGKGQDSNRVLSNNSETFIRKKKEKITVFNEYNGQFITKS